MDSNQATEEEVTYRLRGEVDGEVRRYVLVPGENIVGSSRSGHVHLPVPGVSRRHAIVTVAGSRLRIEDLGSKNGTYIDGKATDRTTLEAAEIEAGCQLRFGPVTLALESVEMEDAVLGVVLDEASESQFPGTRVDETTYLGRGREGASAEHLRAVEGMLERLTLRPDPDVGGALGLLSRTLGADTAALVEWPTSGQAVVLAASGSLLALPDAAAVRRGSRDRFDARLRWLESEGSEGLFGPVLDAGDEGARYRGLVLFGILPSRRFQPLLSTALRLLMAFRSGSVESLDTDWPETADSDGGLRFPEGIIRGESAAMVALYQQIGTVVRGDVPVLIQGETGVGKEHLAHTVHLSSERSGGPFVAVNCAAIPTDLLEAEMFGIGRGVATGVEAREGRFLEAHGGTLFLDEIGEMPQPLQAKLLRALQEGQIRPLGSPSRAVDVRVISATNKDLRLGADEGTFRLDLYYRIAGFELRVPPLRERKEDLPRLVGHFLRKFGSEAGKPVRGVTVKALRALGDYDWPGNVRELAHELRRLAYLCPRNQAVDYDMLGRHVLEGPSLQTAASDPVSGLEDWESKGLEEHVNELERELIRRALVKTGGNQTRAAKLLQISRNGIAKRMKRLAMEMDDVVD